MDDVAPHARAAHSSLHLRLHDVQRSGDVVPPPQRSDSTSSDSSTTSTSSSEGSSSSNPDAQTSSTSSSASSWLAASPDKFGLVSPTGYVTGGNSSSNSDALPSSAVDAFSGSIVSRVCALDTLVHYLNCLVLWKDIDQRNVSAEQRVGLVDSDRHRLQLLAMGYNVYHGCKLGNPEAISKISIARVSAARFAEL